MAQYPHLVQMAWYTVEQLVDDWAKNPHYWEREIDIQSELRGRLSTIFSLTGFGHVMSQEKDSQSPEMLRTYRFSRVCCEPNIRYTYSDGKEYGAKPDIVVWDALPDPLNQPEDRWPILWACEIKYKYFPASEWDIEKLGYLLDQNRINFGCWLIFLIDSSISKPSVSWEKSSHGMRLWKCTVTAPSTSGTQEA